jgi:hypothetical protein
MKLLKSRAFITALIDAIVKIVFLVVGKYAAPDVADMLHQIWLIAQPIVGLLLVAFTINDEAAPLVQRAISRELTSRGLHLQTPTVAGPLWRGDEFAKVKVIGGSLDDIQPPEAQNE